MPAQRSPESSPSRRDAQESARTGRLPGRSGLSLKTRAAVLRPAQPQRRQASASSSEGGRLRTTARLLPPRGRTSRGGSSHRRGGRSHSRSGAEPRSEGRNDKSRSRSRWEAQERDRSCSGSNRTLPSEAGDGADDDGEAEKAPSSAGKVDEGEGQEIREEAAERAPVRVRPPAASSSCETTQRT
ncbi:unnamed protein product [Polarella glacialis]|uniref:Uncharacterized protein n=1 Tax=Polarella glacialis TaxID=89957 RepID=A0A813HJN3_POLGL|nr:unnamed protein product [Polarella glacialis]